MKPNQDQDIQEQGHGLTSRDAEERAPLGWCSRCDEGLYEVYSAHELRVHSRPGGHPPEKDRSTEEASGYIDERTPASLSASPDSSHSAKPGCDSDSPSISSPTEAGYKAADIERIGGIELTSELREWFDSHPAVGVRRCR